MFVSSEKYVVLLPDNYTGGQNSCYLSVKKRKAYNVRGNKWQK